MWECVNALVWLIGKMSCGIEMGHRETVEGSSKDRLGITNLWVENQQLAILFDSHMQCAGFQQVCNCYKEGGKNVLMWECGNVLMRECVNA